MAILIGAAVVAAVGAIAGAGQAKKAAKKAKVQGDLENNIARTDAARAEANLFVQAEASNQQRALIADNLLLQDKQRTEVKRQADMSDAADFSLGESANERTVATKRRGTFFDYESGA